MASFQKTLLVIAAIVLIISFIAISIMIYNTKQVDKWPPIVSKCPDWWTEGADGKCSNPQHIGTCTTFDPSDTKYTGTNGPCERYKWATGCGAAWDGVTYGVDSPCDTLL
jgi:hypothetical protein